MSVFKRMLARVGIGSVTVDTILENEQLVAGEEAKGIVQIVGGSLSQQIDGVYITLSTQFTKEVNDKKIHTRYDLERMKICGKITIDPNEKKEIPFIFPVPLDTPITLGRKLVWLHTNLDIKNSLDPEDDDYIDVLPSSLTDHLLTGIEKMGFRLRQMTIEEAPYRFRKRLPFVQEFEFIPYQGLLKGKLDELEILLFPSTDKVEVIMEIDRKPRGLSGLLSEALDMDESIVSFIVTNQNKHLLEQQLTELIAKHI